MNKKLTRAQRKENWRPGGSSKAGLIAGGCVSKSTFKKMAEEKNQEIATLQQQNAAIAS